jgi:signal transduction histidine kinase
MSHHPPVYDQAAAPRTVSEAPNGRQNAVRSAQHELANALALVSGYLELSLADDTLRPGTREALDEAWRAAEQARHGLQQLRELTTVAVSQPEAGG